MMTLRTGQFDDVDDTEDVPIKQNYILCKRPVKLEMSSRKPIPKDFKVLKKNVKYLV